MTTIDKASGAKPLYMYRSVLNAEQITEWAREQGFTSALEPDDMHITIVFSRAAFSQDLTREAEQYDGNIGYGNIVIRGGKRAVVPLGDKGAVVLKVESSDLQDEHQMFRRMGASWDFQEYTPHITITYAGTDTPPAEMQPYTGDIVLGPLRAKLLNTDWDSEITEVLLQDTTGGMQKGMEHQVTKSADILKLDSERRIAWGWAYVSTIDGELQTDTQGDSITPAEMEKMADKFMSSARMAKAMHEGDQVGEVIHSLPLTTELAKAFSIETDREGWLIGMKVHDDAIWKQFKNGTLKGFSIGGKGKRKPKKDYKK